MHRFSDASQLSVLTGQEVWQICLGQYQTQLIFSDETTLRMEGDYVHQIRAESREIAQERSSSGPNELHRLLGKTVIRVRVLSPASAELIFSNGDALLLIDDSDQYESFIVTLKDRIIVI
jgi:hypothetical protein